MANIGKYIVKLAQNRKFQWPLVYQVLIIQQFSWMLVFYFLEEEGGSEEAEKT